MRRIVNIRENSAADIQVRLGSRCDRCSKETDTLMVDSSWGEYNEPELCESCIAAIFKMAREEVAANP